MGRSGLKDGAVNFIFVAEIVGDFDGVCAGVIAGVMAGVLAGVLTNVLGTVRAVGGLVNVA